MKKLVFGAAFLITLAACSSQQKESADEWQIVWMDDFDGDTIDNQSWSKIPRGKPDWSNYMSDYDPLYAVRDGNLVLRGIVTPEDANDSVPYITGGIYTLDKVGFEHGRVEVRARLHGAKGAWPAIWLMPMNKTEEWPWCGEIDIMERLNNDSIVYQTVHSNYTFNRKLTDYPKAGITAPINRDDYNVYAVELYPDSIRFFVNDQLTNTYPRIETEYPDQFPFDKEWYLMLDMQLEGTWVGEADPADLPVEMEVDWVKFLKK